MILLASWEDSKKEEDIDLKKTEKKSFQPKKKQFKEEVKEEEVDENIKKSALI